MFLYRSVAQQHGLKYIVLPDSINLKEPKLDDYYANAMVEISGKKPGELITKKGEAMVYGITMINNSSNKVEALKFLKFLLSSNKGMKIMNKNGQQSLVPSPTDTYSSIPNELNQFVLKE